MRRICNQATNRRGDNLLPVYSSTRMPSVREWSAFSGTSVQPEISSATQLNAHLDRDALHVYDVTSLNVRDAAVFACHALSCHVSEKENAP